MGSMKLFDRRAGVVVAVVALLLSTFIPAFASAAQVTERSIALSSSSADAGSVSYQVNFTATQTAGAFVVEFCDDTPLIGEACNPPDGFVASAAASVTSGVTAVTGSTNKFVVTKPLTAGTVSVDVTGIHNPTAAGPLYARIVTYDSDTNANLYQSEDLGSGVKDEGSVAISITNTVGVSGAVLESMIFCVSGETINANCVGGGAAAPNLAPPTLKLGKDTNGVVALDSSDVYNGTIYSQISTNAVNGAIISLKSSAAGCGGLINSSKPDDCYIVPAGITGDITAGQAKFGLKLGADVTDATNGDLKAASTNYSSTAYRLNYVDGDASGVTGPYGDPILNTNSKPANNLDMPLTFGASVSNNTPAGNYSADLSLVATGKF